MIILIAPKNLYAQHLKDLILPQVVKDTFYGKVVEDPYRFLENIEEPKVDEWLHKQSNIASTTLYKINSREAMMGKQKRIKGKRPRTKYLKITENSTHFYLKKRADEKLYKLYYRNGFNGNERLLYNPEDYKKGSETEYLINYIQPSWDASKIAIGLTSKGKEFSEIVILDVASKEMLPEIITNSWPSALGGLSWLKDNSGFIYTHVPVMDKTSEDYILNTASVLYKLGKDPKDLNIIFSARNNPDINIKPADFPMVYYKPYYGNTLLGSVGGASVFSDYYYSKINDKGEVTEWKPLYKKEDKVNQLHFSEGNFYFLSALNTPNYKLCKTSISNPDFKHPEILVAEDPNAVITDFTMTKSGIYYVKNKNGVDAQLYCFRMNKEQKINIPKQSGDINVSSKSPKSDDLWIEIEGWTNYKTRYHYKPGKIFTQEDLYPRLKSSELEDVVVEEIEVVSYDGVKVPLSIIYKKGTKLNGDNRVLMYGYGAFGYSNTPYLYDFLYHWLREGGIYVVAHIRGGGEKGESWHKEGYKQTKPNTWKDFIACTEFLIDKGYTNPDKMSIWAASAGGILIARTITERPELFSAAIILSGKINMLRSEFGPNGKNTIKEYGTVTDSTEFRALFEMDACQHVKSKTKYPAVLLLAGANDARVPVWHSAKFAASLQAVNSSKKPILLSVDYGAGHGPGMASNKKDLYTVDILTFALWQTGHPDFQLKE